MPSVHEHHLNNGMTLLFFPQTHLHSLCFGLFLGGGALYENRETQGVSHLVEHLCFRALGGLDAIALNGMLDRMGTELDGETGTDAIVYRMKTHPRYFDNALDLFFRFFSNTPWTAKQIDEAKQIVLRQIEQDETGFEEEIDYRWRVTDEGAYPVMGTAASVTALSEETVRAWQQMIFQPCNACLCLSGNFSPAMEDAVCQTFSELTNTTAEKPFACPMPAGFCMRDAESDLVLEQEGGQAKVHLAFDLNDEPGFTLAGEVLNTITAQDNDSILFQVLREQEALIAEIDSTIEELGPYHRLVIRYDVRQECLEESLKKVISLLCRLKMYVRPVRMDEIRTQYTLNLDFYLDEAETMVDMMGNAYLAEDLSRCDLDAKSKMYEDLTVEEVLDCAQAVLRPENLVISVQRDPNRTKKSLKPLFAELRGMLE